MAIFGPFSSIRLQLKADARFRAALAYVDEILQPGSAAARRMTVLVPGVTERAELAGGAFALEQAYQPRVRAEGFFESHRRYIDVQVIVEGEELMEVEDVSRLIVATPFHAERDLITYADGVDTAVLRMRAGDAAVFFPEDGHMPSLHWRGNGLVRKTVVKVPVSVA